MSDHEQQPTPHRGKVLEALALVRAKRKLSTRTAPEIRKGRRSPPAIHRTGGKDRRRTALPDGTTERLGVFLSSQKGRRHRLTDQQLAALANLGLEWAA